jgi:hypothetical protein
VNFPLDFQRLLPIFAVVAVALAAVALVARGLGGGGAGESTQQVLDQALGGGKGATSGRFEATLSVALQGVPAQASKPLAAKFSGAFERAGSGRPQFDLNGTVDAAGQNDSFGFVSTGDKAFVELRGKAYVLPAGRLQQSGAPANASPFTALGVNPRSWFTNVRDAGSAEVGGVPVQHLTADFDTARAFADLQELAAKSGQAGQVPETTQKTIADAVKRAKVDLFTGKSDHLLRKLAVTGQLAGTSPNGGPALQGTINFDLEVTDVNQPQRITAPRNAAPISELGGTSPGTSSGGKAAPSHRRGAKHRTTKSPSAGGRRSRQAYISCVQGAPDLQALDKCQAFLP